MLNSSARLLLLTALASFTLACTSDQPESHKSKAISKLSTEDLRIVTWNVEHLAYPIGQGCKPRTSQELAALKSYAQKLEADIVALQEVASEQAVRLLFPASNWQVVMSERPDSDPYTCRESGRASTQQKLAYAIRKGIKISDIESVSSLGLEMPGLRHGLAVDVAVPGGEMRLLNVHLKSGCFVDDYTSADREACDIFAQQIPVLKDWISKQQQEKVPFIILGDFNHRISESTNRFRQELNHEHTDRIDIATETLISCHPRYPVPIDHIVAGNLALQGAEITAHHFDDMQEDAMLSDHCAVSISF